MMFDVGVAYYPIFEKRCKIGGNYTGGGGGPLQKWPMGSLETSVLTAECKQTQ